MEENVMKLRNMIVHIQKTKEENLKIMMGGDMNGHIWELDKCENVNEMSYMEYE